MDFSNYYFKEDGEEEQVIVPADPNSWADRRVSHRTPSGKISKIKIKYLPQDQKLRYAPSWYKKLLQQRKDRAEANGEDPNSIQLKLDTELNKSGENSPNSSRSQKRYNAKRSKKSKKSAEVVLTKPENPYTFDFYFVVEDPDKFNVVSKTKKIYATMDAQTIAEEEDKGNFVVEVLKVPMSAIYSHKDEEKDKWYKFDKDLTDEEKFDKIKFSDDIWYKLDLYKVLDDVRFNLLTDSEGEEDINESYEDAAYEWYDRYYEKIREIMYDSQHNNKQPWYPMAINRLQKIWTDYSKFGVVRDERGLDDIADNFIDKILTIDVNTMLAGHTIENPDDVLDDMEIEHSEDIYDKVYSYIEDERGQPRISDYGLNKLKELASKILTADTYENKLLYIDQVLNVVHQRSDLASMFVQGGRGALNNLSNQ